MTRTHTDLQELIGAYVCDAVDADERDALERHLPACPQCRSEVSELREVTALLANAQAAMPAPEGLWDRIVSSLEETPPPLRLAAVPAETPAAPDATVTRLDSRDLRRRVRAVALAVATAAALVAGVLGFSLGRTTGGSIPSPGGLQAAAYHALAEPGSRTASLLNSTHVKEAVAVVRADGQGYLIGDNLPALTDHVYQLWGATPDGTIVSLGVINYPSVVAFNVGDPGAINTLMLTEEIHPVDHTSNPPVVQGALV